MGSGFGIEAPNNSNTRIVDAILETCPSVKIVSPEIGRMQLLASHKGENKELQVAGVSPYYPKAHNWDIQSGRFIQPDDVELNSRVCVIGWKVRTDFFAGADPINRELRLENADLLSSESWWRKGIRWRPKAGMSGSWCRTQRWNSILSASGMGDFISGCKRSVFEEVEQAVAEIKIALRRQHESEEHFQFFTAKGCSRTGRECQSHPTNSAWWRCQYCPVRWWDWHHEHHAGLRDGAHQRNRTPQSCRRTKT